jgi:hypothetical protein
MSSAALWDGQQWELEMGKDFAEALTELELELCRADHAAELEQHYRLDPDLADRIADIASSLDQAHAIAELMR